MNSRQRRRQRRFIRRVEAPWDEALRRVGDMATAYRREIDTLTHCLDRADARIADLKKSSECALAKLRESTDHEIRKLTENAKRLGPLVAELQIALRHIAQAASIVGADPGPAAVADVPSVNELRQKVLAALKGTP